jgi:hypothetical protein
MTRDELVSHVWDGLPRVQRGLAGRRVVNRIVTVAIRNWPLEVLEQCDTGESQVVGKHYTKTVDRAYRQQYGMGLIFTIVLATLVQEIVKLMLKWWLERSDNRPAMRQMMSEVRHHD